MYKELRDAVLLAEFSMLLTLNFSLQTVTPYRFIRRAFAMFSQTTDPDCNAFWTRKAEETRSASPTSHRRTNRLLQPWV